MILCLWDGAGGAEIYSLSLEVIADHEVIIMATPKSVIRIGDTDVGHKTGNRGETVVLRFAQLSNQGDRTSLVHKVLLNVINAENVRSIIALSGCLWRLHILSLCDRILPSFIDPLSARRLRAYSSGVLLYMIEAEI